MVSQIPPFARALKAQNRRVSLLDINGLLSYMIEEKLVPAFIQIKPYGVITQRKYADNTWKIRFRFLRFFAGSYLAICLVVTGCFIIL